MLGPAHCWLYSWGCMEDLLDGPASLKCHCDSKRLCSSVWNDDSRMEEFVSAYDAPMSAGQRRRQMSHASKTSQQAHWIGLNSRSALVYSTVHINILSLSWLLTEQCHGPTTAVSNASARALQVMYSEFGRGNQMILKHRQHHVPLCLPHVKAACDWLPSRKGQDMVHGGWWTLSSCWINMWPGSS